MFVVLLVILIVAGRWAWCAIGPAPGAAAPEAESARPRLLPEASLCGLLAGFALSSVGIFLLAHFGRFVRGTIVAAVAAGAAASLLVCWKRGLLRRALSAWRQDIVLGVVLVGLCALLGALLPPIDSTLAASDSSVYLATAQQLARAGTIMHRDALVAGMSVAERDVLLRNRYVGDHTGRFARFPGGVILVSPSSDLVSFYFYHLFPAWLAVGLEFLGDQGDLRLLAVFAAIGTLSLFFIGRRLGGIPLGLGLCAIHLAFQPQAFYSRLPLSELLAQALFVSGLFAFLGGLGTAREDRCAYIRLASLLWGALFLCRVDAIPLLWLGLTLVSLLPRRLGIEAADWAVPILSSVLFAVLAVFHQVANGVDYIGAFSPGGLAGAIGEFVAGRRWIDLVLIAALVSAGLLVHRADPDRLLGRRLFTAARWFGLTVSATILARFAAAFHWGGVATHLQWIGIYTTPLVLAVMGGGLALAAFEAIRPSALPRVAATLAMFAGPACCYLIDPMVVGHQPWVTRRFVPIIFPLFFALSLYGWQAGTRRLFRARPVLAHVAFTLLALAIAGRFLTAPTGLTRHGVPVRARADVRALAGAIPRDALVLVPDENSSLHLQLGLEYACGRDVLLLPLGHDPEGRLEKTLTGYLERQLDGGRRVYVVMPGSLGAVDSLSRRFQLDAPFERTVSFEQVPFVRTDQVPGPPLVATLRVSVSEVRAPLHAAGSPAEGAGR